MFDNAIFLPTASQEALIVMRASLKSIFYASVFCLSFWILEALLGTVIQIECISAQLRDIFELTRFWGVPIAVFGCIIGLIKEKDSHTTAVIKIITATIFLGLSLLFMLVVAFGSMCSWTTDKVIFETKTVMGTQIVMRSFGCGATDSGTPLTKVQQVKHFGRYYIWVTDVDTNTIDKTRWHRVDTQIE